MGALRLLLPGEPELLSEVLTEQPHKARAKLMAVLRELFKEVADHFEAERA